MSYLKTRRTPICRTCPKQCPDFINGTLDITSPISTCPRNRWPRPIEIDLSRTVSVADVNKPELLSGGLWDKRVWGPPMWDSLHSAAKAGLLTPDWIADFTRRVPCGECRLHWMKLLQQIPPRYDDQYQWSVDVHNEVNKRIGKPVWAPEATDAAGATC